MSIFNNAIDSITLGIEDFQSRDARRLISSARNLYAGILLLFKSRLAELSPANSDESLIKARVLPVKSANTVYWKGLGKKTVDAGQIKERFDSLGISADWARVNAVQDYRNNIEHYHDVKKLSQRAVRKLIADCFIVISDFLRDESGADPLKVFEPEIWNTFVAEAEVYKKEKDSCVKSIQATDWEFLLLESVLLKATCPECGSGLLEFSGKSRDRDEAIFKCRSCGKTFDFRVMVEEALNQQFAEANYRFEADGQYPVTIRCPACQLHTYLVEDNTCLVCEESSPTECALCGCTIPLEEMGRTLCGFCSNSMSKD